MNIEPPVPGDTEFSHLFSEQQFEFLQYTCAIT